MQTVMTKHLSFKVPNDLHDEIMDLKKKRFINPSEVTRELWQNYIQNLFRKDL